MDVNGEVSLSFFLAGALLKNKSITYIELTNYMSSFEETTSYNIIDNGLYNLYDIIYSSGRVISLNRNYNDLYNGTTIEEYLYSMTNDEIRKFFGIEEKITKQVNDFVVRKKGILSRIKTRVF